MSNIKDVRRDPIYISLDRERQLKYDLNAFATMEEKYGTVDAALAALDNGSIKAVRFILWVGLIHEDENLTEKQVGAMIELQDLQALAEKMNMVMGADLPDKQNAPVPNEVSPMTGNSPQTNQ